MCAQQAISSTFSKSLGACVPRCGLTAQQAAYGHAYSADPMRLPFV